MKPLPPSVLDVKVAIELGTYITNRTHGAQASCTSGAKQAAERLGLKLYGESFVVAVAAPHNLQNGESHWRLHAEPVFAFAWQTGLIGFGRVVPESALGFATGFDIQLRQRVAVLARHGQRAANDTLLVPGVPEADDALDKIDALIYWVDQCAENNEKPVAQGVVFSRKLNVKP